MTWARRLGIIFLVIGIIGMSFNMLFGYGSVGFLTKVREPVSGLWYWKYDSIGYINNLSLSINSTSELTLHLPTRTWNDDILNNLALMLDWWLFLINVLIYPMRIGAYLLKQVLAIVGIDMINTPQTSISWLVDLVNFLQPLEIQYV